MIQSSIFSLDESSVWDPKVIREHLCIPEEQLNVLSDIPGWSKVADNANTFRVDKDTTTQNSQFILVTTQNCQKNKQTFELFDKHLELQGSVLKTYEAYKFTRSISLCEIDKLCENVVDNNRALKRTSSLPVLCKSFDNSYIKSLHQNSDSETASSEKYLSCIRKVLPVQEPVECSVIWNQKDTSIPKSGTLSEGSLEAVEVVSQLPVNISSHTEKVGNNKSVAEVVEKMATGVVHTTERSGNLSEQSTAIANSIVSVNSKPIVYENKHRDKPYDSQLSENKFDSVLVKDTVPTEVSSVSLEAMVSQLPVISSHIEKVAANNELIAADMCFTHITEISNIMSKRFAAIENGESMNNNKPIAYEKEHRDKPYDLQSSENKFDSILVKDTVPTEARSTSSEAMEVVSQLPINISSDIEKVVVSSDDLMAADMCITHIIELSDIISKRFTAIANGNESVNNAKKTAFKKYLKDKPYDSESSENKFNSILIKDTIPTDVSSIDTEKDKMKCRSDKLTEISETPKENLESLKPAPKKQPSSAENLILNDKENSKAQDARIEDLNDKKVSQQKTGGVTIKSATKNKGVPEKRKLDIKMKFSKRRRNTREKLEYGEVRSIKRAGDIHYTDEETKTMINIMKHFS